MIDLRKISGLPILFDEKRLDLEFLGTFPSIEKSIRTLAQLAAYLKNPKDLSGPDPAYQVWREAYLKDDDTTIKNNNLRYDLTLLAPGKIGKEKEFVKTAGHYHQIKPGTNLSYPEVYEVLYGRGYFLIQKMDNEFKKIEQACLIEGGPGEKILIPPGFGHITINVFDEPLLIANWVSTLPAYNYEPFERFHGGAYYFAENELGNIDIIKNLNYSEVPEVKKIRAKELPKLSLIKSKPMYELAHDINKLRFLNYPEEFENEIDVKKVYKIS